MASQKSNIKIYTDQTPNGVKISMTLEELGLQYEFEHVDISTNRQKEKWYLDINPNGRIPAMTDTFTDGEQIRVFESGSIMQYLVSRYDTEHKISYPVGTREHVEMTNWLFFMNSGLGPMQGQANHFFRYAPKRIQYGIDRYINETRRLYRVLDDHLKSSGKPFLVGDKCTIADIAHCGWVGWAMWAGVDINEFPTLKEWEERMAARPAIEKGRNVPKPDKIKELGNDPKKIEEYAKHHSNWIMKGMKDDGQKE